MGKLINIDNGGTLTDIWVVDGGRSFHAKTLTTPYDLTQCFIDGLRKISKAVYGEEDLPLLLQSTDHIRYSTTQGTNALVQRKGPRIGLLLATADDVERLRSTEREREMFDAIVGPRVATLAPDRWTDGRLDAITAAVSELSRSGVSRIVASHSGSEGRDAERTLQTALLKAFPEHLLGTVPVLFAGEMTGDDDFRRRTWSAIFNAFLHPAMELFLYHAEGSLREHRFRNPLLIFRNDGASSRVAKTVAVKTYSSGPRGGAEALKATAMRYGMRHLLMMDVGGTTTDFAEVVHGRIVEHRHGHIEGIVCSEPLCRIVSIGAGGGSVFRVEGDRLHVGPESVGGAPGPACFALGGTQATLTDAMLHLGVLDPATYFGGALALDRERAERAIAMHVGEPLKLETSSAAARMVGALAFKVAEGIREFTRVQDDTVLLGFGGGGPMCALACAEAAGIRTVLVPRLAAVYSAFGISFSHIGHTAASRIERPTVEALRETTTQLLDRVRSDMFSEGFEEHECEFSVEARQDEHVVHAENGQLSFAGLDVTRPVELTVKAQRAISQPACTSWIAPEACPPVIAGMRRIGLFGTWCDVPVLRIEEQSPGAHGTGPAIVEEAYFTCVVLPGWTFEVTMHGDLLMHRRSGEA